MRLILNIFLVALGVSFASFTAGAFAQIFRPQADNVPWPWGEPCPMVSQDIEGLWTLNSESGTRYFEFKAKAAYKNGDRLVEIRGFDANFNMVVFGHGIIPASDLTMNGVLHVKTRGEWQQFQANVRAYEKQTGEGCADRGLLLFLTVRPDGCASCQARHLHLEKAQEGVRPR